MNACQALRTRGCMAQAHIGYRAMAASLQLISENFLFLGANLFKEVIDTNKITVLILLVSVLVSSTLINQYMYILRP